MAQEQARSFQIDRALAEVGARPHGIIRLPDANAARASAHQRSRRIRSGAWVSLHPGVYRLAGSPDTWEARLLAACFAGGERGRASHRSAAELFDLPGATRDAVEITCPRWYRAHDDTALVIHESTRFDSADTTKRIAIPVTSVEVTLLDLGAVVRPIVVEQALDVALRRDLTTLSKARTTLDRLGRRGRDGTATLRAILDERAPVGRSAESPAETSMRRLLVRNGFPDPVLQFDVVAAGVFLGRVDAAYPQWKIALEYESYEHHTGKLALVRDSARRNRFAAAGWTYLAVTAADLRNGGLTLASALRAAILRAS
jgi:hypothetical protein